MAVWICLPFRLKIDFASSARSRRSAVAHQEDFRPEPGAQLGDDPGGHHHEDADITDLEAFRVAAEQGNEKSGVKITMLAFLIKACELAR